jgi:hypothetical protein
MQEACQKLNQFNTLRENFASWSRSQVKVNGTLVARYGYDPMGRRFWKEQYTDAGGSVLTQALRTY